MRRWAPVLFTAIALPCEATAPSVSAPALAPGVRSASVSSTSADIPHVVRSEAAFFFTIVDFDRDLIIISGAAADSSELKFCGGTEGAEPVPVQYVGAEDGPIKALSVAHDTYIRVYRPIGPFTGLFRRKLCQSTPIAQGHGTHLRTDNDLTAVGGRANSATERMDGSLDLKTG